MANMIRSNEDLPYSIGARCINKDWFGMPMEDVWSIMEEYLFFIGGAFNLRIHSFVLMSNHFHLLASSPERNLSQAMQFFLSQTSRQITKSAGRINHTWRAKHFKTIIGSPTYYLHAYKYFYRNPVEAGIVKRVEDYPFSTLSGLLGRRRLIVPISYDDTLFSNVEKTLEWLNRPTKREYQEAVRKALRRKKFKLPRSSTNGGKHPLEDSTY